MASGILFHPLRRNTRFGAAMFELRTGAVEAFRVLKAAAAAAAARGAGASKVSVTKIYRWFHRHDNNRERVMSAAIRGQ
jgi:hypothetical protein